MFQLYGALSEHQDVSVYADPKYSAHEMNQMFILNYKKKDCGK